MSLCYLASSAWCAARFASGAAKRMFELNNEASFKERVI